MEFGKWTLWKWFSITRHDRDPYLMRLIVFKCPWFAVMLHFFAGSDDECPHDHPWPFWSLILRGGYWEWSPCQNRPADRHGCRVCQAPDGSWLRAVWYGTGSLLRRGSTWLHRVEIDPSKARTSRTISLVFTFVKVRHWGFLTKSGWVHWTKYVWRDHC